MTNRTGVPDLQIVTPLPPLRSGIAEYSHDLIAAVDGRWRLRVVAEPGSTHSREWSTVDVSVARARHQLADLPSIYQLGNSAFHRVAFGASLRRPGIVVLHDTVLHHGRLATMLGRRGRDYRVLMRTLYGETGERAACDVAAGHHVDLTEFPLIEDIVAASRLVIVHSGFARDQVLARVPDAQIMRVPMGVPLPALVDQAAARRALGLPESAFVVASVTHVNPFKRLPVVLRAIRLLRDRIPELVFVVAGSVAPGIDLERQARAYGVDDRVRLLGYVSNDVARLVARAADTCVNLRFPSAGETSASLLRLLGAGRPVLVTRDPSTDEYPRDAVLHVDVGPFEEELVAELLYLLYQDDDSRLAAGAAARRFIEAEHGVHRMADGYRVAVRSAFGIDLEPVAEGLISEPTPSMECPNVVAPPPKMEPSGIDRDVAFALQWLGVKDHDDTIRRVADAMVSLRLDRLRNERNTSETMTETPPIRPDLLEILACPACKAKVRLEGEELVCEGCGLRYPIEDGIPIMLVEEAK